MKSVGQYPCDKSTMQKRIKHGIQQIAEDVKVLLCMTGSSMSDAISKVLALPNVDQTTLQTLEIDDSVCLLSTSSYLLTSSLNLQLQP